MSIMVIIILLVVLAVWIGLIVLGAKIGIKKGYSGWVGGLLVFFLSWIGLIIIAVMGPSANHVQNVGPQAPQVSNEEALEHRLAKLQKMLDDEVITKEEYDTLRKQALEASGE